LIEEAASGVVVVYRHARAGNEVVGRRDIQDRDRLARMSFVDDADFDHERICGGGLNRGHERSESHGKKSAKRFPIAATRAKLRRASKLSRRLKRGHPAGRILFHQKRRGLQAARAG
jgi:hypothetical protein